jgi:gamma-glutamyltranspeptidase/glutathione hydrolase
VGLDILKRGGNAVDAAVAVGFALAVTYPSAGNLGGGGFMNIRLSNGTSVTVDYREKAPASASKDMYLNEDGEVVRRLSEYGHLSCGVPGSVAGLLLALKKYGSMMLPDVIQPAIDLAENGFQMHYRLAENIQATLKEFSEFPNSMRVFTHDSTPYTEGELFVQKDLAKTLRLIRDSGRDGFYRGETAELIVEEMQRGGGLITHDDLEGYEAVIRAPVTGTYRGYDIVSMGPPSSGGVALIQLLNIMEGYEVSRLGHNSSRTIHLMAEAMKRVYADRAEFLGDPDFVDVPFEWLLSKGYASLLRGMIDTLRATPSSSITHGGPPLMEGGHTTHYSVADKYGTVVSTTTTINSTFGSKVVVDGAGFLLNDEMDDFSAKPGSPNMSGLIGSEANMIKPYKRMLSSMTPTIVLKNKKPFMIIGSPGGGTIMTTVLQVIMNVIDFHMDIQEAIDAPRVHHQLLPDQIFFEKRGLPFDVIENLKAMGHGMVERRGYQGLAEGIILDYENGLMFGASDSRGYGVALGY